MKHSLPNHMVALLAALALSLVGGCNDESEQQAEIREATAEKTVTPNEVATPDDLPAPETGTPTPAAQEADAAFGFQTLGQLAAAGKSEDNLLIGPRNIRTALAAVAVGAVGQTRDEILAQT
ncbi:MAG: hypothetical protein LBO79_02790, partial [Zoogloeaceae bacterium]|nr:hypothetical protein [Zoogloeaceae bacterium]